MPLCHFASIKYQLGTKTGPNTCFWSPGALSVTHWLMAEMAVRAEWERFPHSIQFREILESLKRRFGVCSGSFWSYESGFTESTQSWNSELSGLSNFIHFSAGMQWTHHWQSRLHVRKTPLRAQLLSWVFVQLHFFMVHCSGGWSFWETKTMEKLGFCLWKGHLWYTSQKHSQWVFVNAFSSLFSFCFTVALFS